MTAHVRPTKKTYGRVSKLASAADTIAGFDHDHDVAGLTYGQFSLLDLVEAVLDITGPAAVTCTTWTIGHYDLDAIRQLHETGTITDVRVLMGNHHARGQANALDVARIFGPEAVRSSKTHAKFVLIGNAEWDVTVQASMNLNLNRRFEQFHVTDDPGVYAMFDRFITAVFDELAVDAETAGDMPALHDVPMVQPDYGWQVAPTPTMGRVTA